MSRTKRRKFYSSCALRNMSTTNERRQLKGLLADIHNDFPDLPWGKVNRMRRYIPNNYDDVVISAAYEKQF